MTNEEFVAMFINEVCSRCTVDGCSNCMLSKQDTVNESVKSVQKLKKLIKEM